MASAQLFSFALMLLLFCPFLRCQENRVTLNQGNIIGLKVFPETSASPVYVFLGIPYAQAPIGTNRFRHSRPHSGWNQTLFARDFKPICPQPSNSIYDESGDGMLKRPVVMDENCLYLNIWMPDAAVRQGNLPVLVIITGEEMTFDWPQNRPNGLDIASEGVVVVTVQYRSNIFGWLSLQTPELPGNFGLHDQELSLKWIQSNIHKFGGNPKQVTLLGHGTTGAVCAFIHLTSPKSANLFSKAIIMSGTVLSSKSFSDRSSSQEIIAKLGCTSESSYEVVKCLQEKSFGDLQQAFESIYNNGNYSAILGPVSDTFRELQDRYLPTDSRTALKNGQCRSIPILVGITTNEGAFMRDYWLDLAREGYPLLQKYIDTTILPRIVEKFLYVGSSNQNQIIEAITWRFFKQFPETPSYLLNSLQRLASEVEFEGPFLDTIELLANVRLNSSKADNSELFVYSFHQPHSIDMRGKLNLFGGSGHSSDLPLLMGPSLFQQISRRRFTTAEEKLCRQLRKLFTDFMKTGNPTPGRIYDAWFSYTTDRKFIKTLGEHMDTDSEGSSISQFERNLPVIEDMLQKRVVGDSLEPSSNSQEDLNPYRLKGRENYSSRIAKNSYLGNREDYEYYRHLKKVYSFWNVLLPSISPPIMEFKATNSTVLLSGHQLDAYDIKYRHAFFSMLTVVCLLLAILGVCVYILNKNRHNFDTNL